MATHEITRPLALNVTALEIAQALQDVIVTTPVVDNLTTNDSAKALSAKQGKVLKDAHDVNVAAITGIRGTSSAYSSSATYAVGDYAIYNNVLYRCKTAVSTPEAFDAAKWDAVDLKTNRDAINAISSIDTLTVSTTTHLTSGNIIARKMGNLLSIELYDVRTDGNNVTIANLPSGYRYCSSSYVLIPCINYQGIAIGCISLSQGGILEYRGTTGDYIEGFYCGVITPN